MGYALLDGHTRRLAGMDGEKMTPNPQDAVINEHKIIGMHWNEPERMIKCFWCGHEFKTHQETWKMYYSHLGYGCEYCAKMEMKQ
jgi:hypothetical protein